VAAPNPEPLEEEPRLEEEFELFPTLLLALLAPTPLGLAAAPLYPEALAPSATFIILPDSLFVDPRLAGVFSA